jgi:hypothetical protein
MTDQNKATRAPPTAGQPPGGAPGGVPREDIIANSRALPGGRAALPPGTLRGLPPDPQGDENRDPPANAPTIPE